MKISFTEYIALSSVGEEIAKFFYGIRPIATKKEKDFLFPLFEDVYQEVLTKNPKIRKDIGLYMVDSVEINAYALGLTTIALTRGMVETMSKQQLKAAYSP